MSADQTFFRAYAQIVVRRGWTTPVVFFLEAHRPLARICGAGVTFAEPFIKRCISTDLSKFLAALTESPDAVDLFLREIEYVSQNEFSARNV